MSCSFFHNPKERTVIAERCLISISPSLFLKSRLADKLFEEKRSPINHSLTEKGVFGGKPYCSSAVI